MQRPLPVGNLEGASRETNLFPIVQLVRTITAREEIKTGNENTQIVCAYLTARLVAGGGFEHPCAWLWARTGTSPVTPRYVVGPRLPRELHIARRRYGVMFKVRSPSISPILCGPGGIRTLNPRSKSPLRSSICATRPFFRPCARPKSYRLLDFVLIITRTKVQRLWVFAKKLCRNLKNYLEIQK